LLVDTATSLATVQCIFGVGLLIPTFLPIRPNNPDRFNVNPGSATSEKARPGLGGPITLIFKVRCRHNSCAVVTSRSQSCQLNCQEGGPVDQAICHSVGTDTRTLHASPDQSSRAYALRRAKSAHGAPSQSNEL
jgi:hypothetical protein